MSVAGILLFAVISCGGREIQVDRFVYDLQAIYEEPLNSPDPILVFPRDLICLDDRLYVLDGRLAHVAVFAVGTGELLGTFGRMGDGPGELGQFPYALVSDGERVGVAHLYSVSWFTRSGDFLERQQIPPLDISTPSLQYSSGGWLYNATYRGPESPVAVYFSGEGDTLAYGSAVESRQPDAVGLASMELNAVQAIRFENGNVILGWSQENRIEFLSPYGSTLSVDRWLHLSEREERRPDGRLRYLPAYTFNASMGADNLAYLVDGSRRVVRAYDSAGLLRSENHLTAPVLQTAWTAAGPAYAIDGSDRLYKLRPVGGLATQDIMSEASPTGRPESALEEREENSAPLPGEIVECIGDLGSLFEEHGILRGGRLEGAGSRPRIIIAVGGNDLIFLGYEDGQGVLLKESGEKRWEVASVISPHPRGTLRSSILMSGNRPFLIDPGLGIFSIENAELAVEWENGAWPSSVVWLDGERWLVHDAMEQGGEPLFIVDLTTGNNARAGGSGSHRKAGLLFKPAYNWWYMSRWDSRQILVFDESQLRLSFWSKEGLSEWKPVTGSGLRPIEERRKGMIPEKDMRGLVALAGAGFLVYNSDFDGDTFINGVILISTEGQTIDRWNLPLHGCLRSVTTGPGGRLFLNTDDTLYEWVRAREGF